MSVYKCVASVLLSVLVVANLGFTGRLE